jgi:HlyD family secretion protein
MPAGREIVAYRPGLGFAGTPKSMVRGPKRLGLLVIATFVAGFGLWGSLAPLAGGAVARGSIAPDGSVRTVQHLEGGIVDEIFVKDGDFVEVGAPLLALRRVSSQADVEMLLDRRRVRLAEAARLEAELLGAAEIAYPQELVDDPGGAEVIAAEARVFRSRQAMRSARERVLRQRAGQLEEQIVGFEAQVASALAQFDLLQEEISDKSYLVDQGLTPKAELSRLQRSAAEIEGFRGEYIASIAQARQRIGETEIELVALESEWLEGASRRASEVRSELAEIDQQLAARRDVLDRTMITAPVSGVVNHLRTRTVGGVLAAGQDILDLVPTEEKLVIDVQVSPGDIDVVKIGLPAVVHLTALSGRRSPRVDGTVKTVSADLFHDDATGRTYYVARVEVERSALRAVGAQSLTVGMPAEVVIVAEERTVAGYLIRPLVDAIWRAGRET